LGYYADTTLLAKLYTEASKVLLDWASAICIILHMHRQAEPMPTRPETKPVVLGGAFAREGQFLLFLGNRVRQARSRRGMTRKMVAHDADVSERHLAQLEAGEGNISILLLRRIAIALSISLVELFAPESPESPEKRLIRQALQRIPAHRLEEVLDRLTRDFNQQESVRRNRIAFIGLRGAGKSTLGSRLAKEQGVPFVELDREIEKDAGMPLDEIFSLYGQSGYRRIENRTLDRILAANDRAVISVGGGIVSEKDTYDRLLSNCFTVWLKARPEEHMSRVIAQGDFRAMAENDEAMEDLRRILESREPLYRQADLHFDTSAESVDQTFSKLKKALQIDSP
jgi:XRE family transcriptional regulator, aerobic/anaerobic benzoate catabolism transcriptional regulator